MITDRRISNTYDYSKDIMKTKSGFRISHPLQTSKALFTYPSDKKTIVAPRKPRPKKALIPPSLPVPAVPQKNFWSKAAIGLVYKFSLPERTSKYATYMEKVVAQNEARNPILRPTVKIEDYRLKRKSILERPGQMEFGSVTMDYAEHEKEMARQLEDRRRSNTIFSLARNSQRTDMTRSIVSQRDRINEYSKPWRERAEELNKAKPAKPVPKKVIKIEEPSEDIPSAKSMIGKRIIKLASRESIISKRDTWTAATKISNGDHWGEEQELQEDELQTFQSESVEKSIELKAQRSSNQTLYQ